MEDQPVEGVVLIVHQVNEGKHQYEVKSVKKQKEAGNKYFFRRGDWLRMVNNTELQDMDPEKFAHILSQGSPLLTVHKTEKKKKEPTMEKPSGDDVMVPISKEERLLCFSQEMRREEEPEKDPKQDNNLVTGEAGEDGVCTEEAEPNDFLVVSMKKTTISVITGRSCDPKEPCHKCHESKCQYNDIVLVTESSSITLVPRGGSFVQLKSNEAEVEHMKTSMFIRSMCAQNQVYVSQNPERITIYYYKSSDIVTKGIPVVLNFSGSDCFLKCCKNEECVRLQVETCDKQKLKSISRSDNRTLAYVFYMKSGRTSNTTFESALHTGWFIQVPDPNCVQMVKREGPQEEMFFHIIIQTRAC